ncbi:MAG: efflux RND transporter periplasmic adaptor subunit, partial [Candidatus Caldatribacteriaceae bacterium]
MKKRLWPIVIVAIILTAFFWYNRFAPQKSSYFVLEPRDYLETLLAAGRVEFSRMAELSLSSSGIIQAVFVEEGEWVREGDLLVSLDDVWEKNQLQLIQEELELAEIKLRQIVEYELPVVFEEYHQAKINTEYFWREYQRAQILSRSGSISEDELQNARKQWETNLSKEKSTLKRIESLRENGVSYLEAQKNLEVAKLRYKQAEIELRKRLLIAPFDGMVISVNKNSGEFVQPGETVMILGKNPFQVIAKVDEREYPRVKVGMKAVVEQVLNLHRTTFNALVSRVSPTVDKTQGIVEVTLSLQENPPNLKPDAAVNVEIVLKEEKQLLLFPRRYLTFKENKAMVWIEENGRAKP